MTNHEHHPDSQDPKRPGPEREYLQPGEVDFTGAIPQRQDMLDLIGDAFTEAKASGGEIPDWGARAIARILADGLEPGSALHQFAVTGRADPGAISAETIPIYAAPDTPPEVKQWIDYLGTYLLHQDDQPESAAPVSTTHRPSDPDIAVGIYNLSDNESANAAIRRAIALAKDTGGTIHPWIAYAIARHLADQLPDQASALSTFADNSTIDAHRLTAETRAIAHADTTPDEVREWISFFDAFVASRTSATSEPSPVDGRGEASAPSPAERIETGIAEASQANREIDQDTAMAIAGALAEQSGVDGALARFADTGVGGYLALREEYLDLYTEPSTPANVKRWIDWFGTFLVQRENTGSGQRFMNEHLDPQLDRVLVTTAVPIWGRDWPVHAPATLTARDLIRLGARLEALEEIHEPAFRAFLQLPDVNAADSGLVDTFHETYVGTYRTIDHVIDELTEITDWQTAVDELSTRLGIDGLVTIDRSAVERLARERWDITEADGVLHVFEK